EGPGVQPRAPRAHAPLAHPRPGLWPRLPRRRLPRCRCRTPPPSCPGCPSSVRKRAAAAERPKPLLPGPFLFLLLRGPSFGPTFFPQPEVNARPHPPFKIQPARKGWGWEGGGRDWQ
ncbi:unnamed protein product, partial [Gulo gulo]